MREDVTFTSGADPVAAWWYAAAGAETAPCVVMAHGFSLTRSDGLPSYAEALQAAGVHVLVFDHRYLGDSGGEPRQRFRVADQHEDWRSAVGYARGRADVDASRVVLWGYSFSGGHVSTLLAKGIDVCAAMVLCPFVDGVPRVLGSPPRTVAWILPRAVADVAGRHNLIPVTAPAGTNAAMNLPGEADGFAASIPDGSRWRNEISPGLFASVAFFRPVAKAKRIGVPLWVGRCADDVSADFKAIGKLAARAPRAELHDYEGDHFAPFHGALPARVAADQVDFLRRTVLG